MIIVPVIYFCYGGTFGIFPTQTVRIFGEKLGGNIYWIVFSGFSISAILQFTIRYLLISNLGLEEGYNILMGIYVGFEIIGLIIAQKIDYEYAVN